MSRDLLQWIAVIAFCAMPLPVVTAPATLCENGACAAAHADIVWSHETRAFPSVPARLVIAGTKKDGAFAPSYLVLSDAVGRIGSDPLPWLSNLLPTFDARAFGADERARLSRSDDGSLVVECAAGSRPAGVVLSTPGFHYPRGLRGELVVSGTAQGDISVALADAGADASAPVVPAGSRPDDVLARFPSGAWEQGAAAKQLVITCAGAPTQVKLRAIRIVPMPGRQTSGLGTWLWNVAPWRERPDRLVALAKSRDVKDIFMQVEIVEGRVVERAKLLTLIGKLAAAGITVHAVEGDPEMAMPAGRTHALARARVLRALYEEARGALKPAQYDIEPYLLAQFDTDPAGWWNEWAVSIEELSRALGEKVSVAVPFWMLDQAAGRAALEKAGSSVSSFVVMAYRTDSAELNVIAGKWLDWGYGRGAAIQIALENGPLPAEYHRAFVLAERGEVLLERSGATDRIVMLAAATAGTSTRPAYSFTKETEISPKRISFMNDRGKLNEVLRKLRPNLSASEAFEGLLVHEIMIP